MATSFCGLCQNLLYIKVDEGRGLTASCNYCLDSTPIAGGTVVLSETSYRSDAAKYSHLLTPLLHHDPTLPRVTDVPCPSPGCSRKEGEQSLALFVKYDAINLRFLYSCCHCKHFWVPGAPSQPDGAPGGDEG